MGDTPYREGPLVAPRAPRGDEVETENPPHVRVAGAMLIVNALAAVALSIALARQDLPASVGLTVVTGAVDLALGVGLLLRRPRRVLPAGLRRLAVLRLFCGIVLSFVALNDDVAAGAMGAFGSLAPLALLTRRTTRARVAVSALAQSVTLACLAWMTAWLATGERLFWGELLHARGELGEAARGAVADDERHYAITLGPGWWRHKDEGPVGSLTLSRPSWGAELALVALDIPWSGRIPDDEHYLQTVLDDLDERGISHGRPRPLTVEGASPAVRVRLGTRPYREWLYLARVRAGGRLVVARSMVPERAARVVEPEVLAALRSLRVAPRGAEEFSRGEGAPLASPAPRVLRGQAEPWSVDVPEGWWMLSAAQSARSFGTDWTERGMAAPFEAVVVSFAQGPADMDVAWFRETAMATEGAAQVEARALEGVADGTEYDATGADGEVVARVLALRRDGGTMVARVLGQPTRGRLREVTEMLRGARLAPPGR